MACLATQKSVIKTATSLHLGGLPMLSDMGLKQCHERQQRAKYRSKDEQEWLVTWQYTRDRDDHPRNGLRFKKKWQP